MTVNLIRNVLTKIPSRSTFYRSASSQALLKNEAGKMSSWIIHSYGDMNELTLAHNARIPHINAPDEVLVKVEASSVNPLDVAMINGYGSTIFNMLRKNECVEFPLTMGRDFSGTIENKGLAVDDMYVGDKIWGVLPPHWQGAHAEYVIVKREWISAHPKKLSSQEGSSILYAGLTAWSAINIFGGMYITGMNGKRVLLLGPSGGVGSMALQILKAGDAYVVSVCSNDAMDMVKGLGADLTFDRFDKNVDDDITRAGPYDLVLDCAGLGTKAAHEKNWNYRTYVSCSSPLLRNTDQNGLISGLLKSALSITCTNVSSLSKGRTVRWAYFMPSSEGIANLYTLVEAGLLKPVIEKVYPFEELPEAYQRVKEGHLRGKIVIDVGAH